MEIPACWPEPIIPVQLLAESGIKSIPQRYVKRPRERPSPESVNGRSSGGIPLIDLGALERTPAERDAAMRQITNACKEWGFFHISNHGVDADLIKRMKNVWREFFHLPFSLKQVYSNTPQTYEGYGSRLGVEKGAILDWSDYFFLIFLPETLRNRENWPALPHACKETVDEYAEMMVGLCERLMEVISRSIGLEPSRLHEVFGGREGVGATLRANFYPRCPEPELALGLSAHSDPGILTILLSDERIKGLQVHHDGEWVDVEPIPDTFIVNIGDQIQVLTNGQYKSLEHRVVVNPNHERYSFAFFYNPRGDLILGPLSECTTAGQAPLYQSMAFDEYRKYIRTKGPRGKNQIESMKVL